MTRRDPVDTLLDLTQHTADTANATHISEGEARRWSPVAAAAEVLRAEAIRGRRVRLTPAERAEEAGYQSMGDVFAALDRQSS